MKLINSYFKGKIILITGGSGSLGNFLLEKLIPLGPKEIRIFSLDENRLAELKIIYRNHPNIKFQIGDIRDKESIKHASVNTDIVFNLAALKHVSTGEETPNETIKTNIFGLQNVISSAGESGTKVFVQSSSDKAVQPSSTYGMSKHIGEKLVISANSTYPKTKFISVRLGNILGSAGSMVPLFKLQIATYNKIFITDKEMSRFILTASQAAELMMFSATHAIGGEIYASKMPSIKVVDLANAIIKKLGNKDTEIEYTGKRPGEKIFSLLFDQSELNNLTVEEDTFIISPKKNIKNLSKAGRSDVPEIYSSETLPKLNNDQISKLLLNSL